ncbi:putative plant self-incompatibility S1 [Medicago truncatula]|uniref:S-protein homolog n=1 Tax=Medicago truncatula TaxID=3880 RepID=G7ZZ52_MEDTR|nr:S-protein homolog 29 [Medicago truncatula]KEH25291.1 leguminosin group486 secreted peptide [Medicago truncatula]RHN50382.1 putative plant self-incompatibility S1 [Medicago truncatula]
MTVPNSISLKFSILIIILLAFEASDTIAISFAEVKVTIVNKVLAPTPTNITFHCKSRDDDLGFHTLVSEGSYAFTFSPNFTPWFSKTLFFCSFTWPGNPQLHYLDIYDQVRDNCYRCRWTINKDGGCLNTHKCYKWNSVKLMDA